MTNLMTMAAAIGGCLGAGVYLSFAAIVMPALGRLPASDAAAAMARINLAAVRPPFMLVFFGGAAAAGALAVVELVAGRFEGRSAARLLGASLVLASHAVTVAANVPLNNRLAALAADEVRVRAYWPVFAARWGRANGLRTVAAALGAAVLTESLAS